MSEFIVIIRPSFMKFCKDACRAAAFNHILFRIAGKAKDQRKEKIQNGDILWYAKTEQISEEMADAWGVCKVRKEVNAIVDMGIVGRRSNPTWGADRTKHFCFGQKECRKFLQLCEEHHICFVHLDLPDEVKHLIYVSNANDKSIKCTCAIHQMETMDVSNANDKSIEAITIDLPPIDDNKEENKESVSPSVETTTQVSTHTPSEINDSSEFASHLPQGNAEKPIPPNPDKSQVNTKPALTSQELADRRHWAKYVSKDDNITKADVLNGLNLHYQWVATYGAYGKAPWCDKALIWIAQQSNGTWENVQKVYDALPETAINPENVANNWHRLNGKKKASRDDAPSTPLDTERNERNLQNLLKRAAEKRAAQATTE